MWCGECGSLMQRRDDGAWHGCCNRLGYWTREPPLPHDRWYPVDVIVPAGYFFYATAKWPRGHIPHVPKEEKP